MPGLETVRLGEERALLRTEAASLTLEGPSVALFLDGLLPRLDGKRNVGDIAAIERLASADLYAHLADLERAGVLQQVDEAPGDHPLAPVLALLGLPPARAGARLAAVRAVVFGLDAVGLQIGRELLGAGIGTLTLHDHVPLADGDALLRTAADRRLLGRPRHDLAVERLASAAGAKQSVAGGAPSLDIDVVRRLAEDADLMIGAFDRGYAAAHHWINRVALETGVPALFVAAGGLRVTVGPLVVPGETACFMCWRMRELATAEDFAAAMGYEEQLDAARRSMPDRPTLPTLAPLAAGLAASEALKLLLAIGTPMLTSQVAAFDALSGRLTHHPVLFRPDCPVCQKKTLGHAAPTA